MLKCKFIDNCLFFKKYEKNTNNIIKGWQVLYCTDEIKSNKCFRKQYALKHGKPAPANMLPTGKIQDTNSE